MAVQKSLLLLLGFIALCDAGGENEEPETGEAFSFIPSFGPPNFRAPSSRPHYPSLLRALVWPEGNYGLPKPENGCPGFEGLSRWERGELNFHSQSQGTSQNDVSSGTALMQPVFTTQGSKEFVNFFFCMKSNAAFLGPAWEPGSFCIYKEGACPFGFSSGSMFYDAEDVNNMNSRSGSRPDGFYGNNVRLFYCCRNDGSPHDEIVLPTQYPFYLFRFGGTCQKVRGMKVREEFIVIDTENNSNDDEYSNEFHPDGTLNNIRLELCYYKRPSYYYH